MALQAPFMTPYDFIVDRMVYQHQAEFFKSREISVIRRQKAHIQVSRVYSYPSCAGRIERGDGGCNVVNRVGIFKPVSKHNHFVPAGSSADALIPAIRVEPART